MRRLFLFTFIFLTNNALLTAGDFGVSLFSGQGFTGERIVITEDWNLNPSAEFSGVQSIRVPLYWEIYVYKEAEFQGEFMILDEKWTWSEWGGTEWKNAIKSIRVAMKFPQQGTRIETIYSKEQVVLFAEPGFRGQHIFIKGDWSNTMTPSFQGIGSIRVPDGWQIRLYQFNGFKGDSMTLYSHWEGTGTDDWKWRNSIRSIRIISTNTFNMISDDIHSYDSRAVLFSGRGFKGKQAFIGEDWNNVPGSGFPGIESIRVPQGWEVYAYRQRDFAGDPIILDSHWEGNIVPGQGQVSIQSLRITRKVHILVSNENIPCVRIYADAHYSGESKEICSDWSVGGSEGMEWSDRISSFKVPPGMKAVVYEFADFKGRSMNITGWWTVSAPDAIWNDRIRSIRIAPVME